MAPKTTISARGTVRTNSPLVALYFQALMGYRVASRWHKPLMALGPVMFYAPRWELRPTCA